MVSVAGIMMDDHPWFHFSSQSFVWRRLLDHGHDPRSPGGLATNFIGRPFDDKRKKV